MKEKKNIVRCRNKLCALYNENASLNCDAIKLGLDKYDIKNCNLRNLYQEWIKRETHDKWLDKKRGEWNKYQKLYRNRKNKNE